MDPYEINIPARAGFALVVTLLGFLFFPLFFAGGFLFWALYKDIKEAPAKRAEAAEIERRLAEPPTVEQVEWSCESPAETAFLNAMIEAYDLKPAPYGLAGKGLHLKNQMGLGNFRVHGGYQYRADFVVDDKFIVEIDGAAYHSSKDARERDAQRDADIAKLGYPTLRIPAKVVFNTPEEAVRRVEEARQRLPQASMV